MTPPPGFAYGTETAETAEAVQRRRLPPAPEIGPSPFDDEHADAPVED